MFSTEIVPGKTWRIPMKIIYLRGFLRRFSTGMHHTGTEEGTMAQVTASEVAKHILANFTARGEAIGNLKLQKLLYYTQGWHLALYCESLFDDRIEAWVHGPVVPGVFREYREFKWTPIVTQPGIVDLPRQVVDHIGEVLDVYEKFSPWDLERMTHNEAPWKEARGPLPPDVPSNALINHESMRLFFTRQMNG